MIKWSDNAQEPDDTNSPAKLTCVFYMYWQDDDGLWIDDSFELTFRTNPSDLHKPLIVGHFNLQDSKSSVVFINNTKRVDHFDPNLEDYCPRWLSQIQSHLVINDIMKEDE